MRVKKQKNLNLKNVQNQFAEWRVIKKVREPIPEKLWQAVEKLLESYTKTEVVRGLGLNHTAMLNRLKQKKQKKAPKPQTTNFIELGVNTEPFFMSETKCDFTYESGSQKLEVRGIKARELIIIIREIWRGKH